jgi:glycine cleavage system transcriptional repressor
LRDAAQIKKMQCRKSLRRTAAPSALMQNHLVITVLGKNTTRLVEQFTRAVKDCGCNISDCRMAALGEEFAMILMVSGTWDSIAKMEDMLPRLEDRLNLSIRSARTQLQPPDRPLMPYAIDVVSYDHIGVVHDITKFIANNNISIQALYTNTYRAAHTGTPMFSLHMTVNIPTDVSIAALRGEFMDFCDQLNLDAIMEPVK